MSWKNLYLITKRSKNTLKAVGKERWDFPTFFIWFILTIKNQSTKLHEDTIFFPPFK